MCKPAHGSRAGGGLGLGLLAVGGIGLGVYLAPAALAGLLLILWAVKVAVVTAAVSGVGYVLWQFAEFIPVPAIWLPPIARARRALPSAARRLAITAGRRALPAAAPRLAVPAPASVRALTPAELAAHRAAQAVN